MAGHKSLTHPERLANRRMHLRHPQLSPNALAKRINISRASVYRVLYRIVRDRMPLMVHIQSYGKHMFQKVVTTQRLVGCMRGWHL